mgnify:CR=1 FL=1|jgi:hypothetical protein
MSDCDPGYDSTPPPRHKLTWLCYSAAAALVLFGWLIAQFVPIQKAGSSNEVSATYNLMVVGAIPWFLQWAGVTCAILTCFGSRNTRSAKLFAILVSLTLAAIWWGGVAFKYRAMDPLEVVLDQVAFAIDSHFGISTPLDKTLFHFIGPILNPLRLRGPINLHGWNFLVVVLSTTLVVGYLLVVGRLLSVGSRSQSASDYVRFVGALLSVFLPPFIRLGLRIVQQ